MAYAIRNGKVFEYPDNLSMQDWIRGRGFVELKGVSPEAMRLMPPPKLDPDRVKG